jgi:hypothetical protein
MKILIEKNFFFFLKEFLYLENKCISLYSMLKCALKKNKN